jgi:hypothetical protein
MERQSFGSTAATSRVASTRDPTVFVSFSILATSMTVGPMAEKTKSLRHADISMHHRTEGLSPIP